MSPAFSLFRLFKRMTRAAVTAMPARIARTNPANPSIAKATKTPPCGARDPTCISIVSAPVTAPPAMVAGMIRSGAAAAKGIAPSEMNEAPRSHAALPFSRSPLVKRRGRAAVASARASGGTMPAAMTAAMIS